MIHESSQDAFTCDQSSMQINLQQSCRQRSTDDRRNNEAREREREIAG